MKVKLIKSFNPTKLFFIIAGALLILFLLIPLISTFLSVDLAGYFSLFTDYQVIESIRLTFWAAFLAVLIGMVVGIPFAYLTARYQFFGRELLLALVNLPVIIPHTAAGVALLLVFGRYGLFGRLFLPIGIQFTDRLAGIVIAMLFVSVPFLVNSARDAFNAVDQDMEKAALVDGASFWQVFLFVTLPLSWRGIFSGFMMMWARGVSEFGAVVILAYHPKIMPVLVFERFQGFGLSAALPATALLIFTSLIIFGLLNWLRYRREDK